MTVQAVNDAPVIVVGEHTLSPSILEDQTDTPSFSVESMIISSQVTDVDLGNQDVLPAYFGIAVVNVDSAQGQWHYSLDGNSFAPFNTQQDALLVPASAALRFTPSPDFHGCP